MIVHVCGLTPEAAIEEVLEGYGVVNDKEQINKTLKDLQKLDSNYKLFEVTINAKEIE